MRRLVESEQYTSIDYTQTLADHRVLASVGSVGDAYDNALAESFVDSFKTELIADRVWRTRSQLELAVVEYISWYNAARLHESLGYIPPAERWATVVAHERLRSQEFIFLGKHKTRSPVRLWSGSRLQRPWGGHRSSPRRAPKLDARVQTRLMRFKRATAALAFM